VVIGTAGHVDHGKTSLVQALTGVDTDRLPEEKRREMTIDLGFAEFLLPSGRRASIVDVPGHERFVGNMLAGATGIDLVLFVVAADEGVRPQTLEHLDILDLLGLKSGVIVLTKSDLAEPEWMEMVGDEVRETVKGTFLETAPVVPVSSKTGAGLRRLAETVDEAVRQAGGKPDHGPARLPVDRVFTVSGFGTVVTGTLVSGRISLEDRLQLLPLGRELRVRGLQVHGEDRRMVSAGERVAINLSGVSRGEVGRGDVLSSPGAYAPTALFDGMMRLVSRSQRPFRSRSRVHLHTGSSEVTGRMLLLDRLLLSPGDSCLVQFHSESPLVVGPRDRFIVRSYSPVRTAGGGEVIDPNPPLRRRRPRGRHAQEVLASVRARLRGDPAEVLLRVLAGEGAPVPAAHAIQQVQVALGIAPGEIEVALGTLVESGRVRQLGDGGQVMLEESWQRLSRGVLEWLDDYHRRWPLRSGAPRDELRNAFCPGWPARRFATVLSLLASAGLVTAAGDRVSRQGYRPVPEGELADLVRSIDGQYRAAGVTPPDPDELAPRVPAHSAFCQAFEYLVDTGVLVRVHEGMFFHRDVLAAAWRELSAYLRRHGAVTVSDFRQELGTSRKYAVPLLEYFDGQKLTRREGDLRLPGQAAALSAPEPTAAEEERT
jgi:selenocysteine-specific elongation factor